MKKTKRAVSLIEIVIAMQCTALLLVMISRVLPLARRQVREADQRLGGVILAQNALEEYLTVPLDEWPSETLSIEGDQQQIQLELQPWDKDSRLQLARVKVMLAGEERYRLETLVMK